ncbi:hypothetical protein CKA32_000755 [Geitlerinema sp. FC II]|nr:hypothetical protein CKA32_000755 [Geitlerinema sp. FC II]
MAGVSEPEYLGLTQCFGIKILDSSELALQEIAKTLTLSKFLQNCTKAKKTVFLESSGFKVIS